MNYAQALAVLLVLEGGLTDNPADPGGRTNLGVTQRTLDAWRTAHPEWNLPASVDQLSSAGVSTPYKATFWDPLEGDSLHPSVAAVLFWQAVNQGPAAVTACVQTLLGLHVDCNFGPVTAAAVIRQAPADFIARFLTATALNYLRSSNWSTFGPGWTRRLFLEALHCED